MKNLFSFSMLLCVLLSCQSNRIRKSEPTESQADISGTYLWQYPLEYKGNLNEDNRIVIRKKKNQYEGIYYGTTDEFVDAREGYYPGFFVLPMDSLRVNEDSIYFVLMPQTKDFFTQPISKDVSSTGQALNKGYSHWDTYDNYDFASLKKYKGFFLDSATIFFEKDSIYNRNSKKFIKG